MKRKTIAILLAVAMVATLCMTGSAMAKAKKQTYKALKSVTVKYYDEDAKKWETSRTVNFKYNKLGDPIKITDKTEHHDRIIVNKFKYKKAKKKSLVSKDTFDYHSSAVIKEKNTHKISYNKYGLRVKDNKNIFYFGEYVDRVVKYKYKKGYVTNVNGTDDSWKYNIKFSKGLPTKITSYYKEGSKWEETSNATFNKLGLYKKITYSEGRKRNNYMYTVKKGLVTKVEAIQEDNLSGEKETSKQIYTFKYTKKKISAKNYKNMINTQLSDRFSLYWY